MLALCSTGLCRVGLTGTFQHVDSGDRVVLTSTFQHVDTGDRVVLTSTFQHVDSGDRVVLTSTFQHTVQKPSFLQVMLSALGCQLTY